MRTITACRSCSGENLYEVVDLGEQYLSEFREDDSKPPKYPLVMMACKDCTLAQLRNSAPPSEMFHNSYSFKSGISDAIRNDLADVAESALEFLPAAKSWLDIACNDGTLLRSVPQHIRRVGVDPLPQFAEESAEHADEIRTEFFDTNSFDEDSFDIVTSISMFYDLDDPNSFVSGVARVLAPQGIWVIQQNYLPTMLENGSLDNISHEHLAYYSMRSLVPLLERHDLEVIDVELNPINGGCFRTFVSHVGVYDPDRSVKFLETLEENWDMSYETFAQRARHTLNELADLIDKIHQAGETVFVYGASTRGAVLWQAAHLDAHQLPYVVERNPAKVGRYMSAIGAKIISEEAARAIRPDYMLLGPWWLRDDVIEREGDYLRSGGRFIIPLPHLEVVSAA